MKTCSKCKVIKSYIDFSNNKSNKDGLHDQCKTCAAKRSKVYRKNNKDRIAERRKNNKYKAAEYRKNNKDRTIEYSKAYYKANIDKISEYTRVNKDKIARRKRKYYKANPEKSAVYCRKRRAKIAEVNENYTVKDAKFTLELFNNQCFNCKAITNLCIDHHKPLSRGYALTRSNAVVLCSRCNSKKSNKMPKEFYSIYHYNVLSIVLRFFINNK